MRFGYSTSRLLAVAIATAGALALSAAPAAAVDSSPCGKEVVADWTDQPVQPCPLTSPEPNGGIPVYTTPIPNAAGATPPAPASWMYGTDGKYFLCDAQFTNAMFYHPKGWRNNWWAYTRSDFGVWGWVSETYFAGGANDEPDYGLRSCPPWTSPSLSPSPSPTPTPPTPTPPASPPAPSPCNPGPKVDGAGIQATFANHRRVITVPYDRRPWVRGRAVGADGSPLAGMDLCVGVRIYIKGRVKSVGSVKTDEDGRFKFRLGHGRSRHVWFVHRFDSGAAAANLLVRVRAPIDLGASDHKLHNGQAVKLRGRMLAAARSGLLVELQALRGNQWQTFATTRTHKGGRFDYRYRFTRTYGVQRYALRARIAAQVGSAFATGASEPVSIQVKG